MDLTEEQRYAAAALFTLSLHSTQVCVEGYTFIAAFKCMTRGDAH